MRKKVVISILSIVVLWVTIFIVDYSRVYNQNEPIFCVQSNEHYTGLGYSFDIIQHPITQKLEHVTYIFGILINNNITN